MKTYTVRQVAELLKTNEETVRRWIRSGKLETNFNSKKEGYVISAESLNRFLGTAPKYASVARATLAASPLGVATIVGSLIGGLISFAGSKRKVSPQDVEIFIKKKINECERKLEKKEAELDNLNCEISAIRRELEKYTYALDNLDLDAVAEGVNNEKV